MGNTKTMKSGGAFFACKINLSTTSRWPNAATLGGPLSDRKMVAMSDCQLWNPAGAGCFASLGWFPQGQGWRLSGYPLKLSCGVNDWEYSNSGSDIQPTLAGSNI